MKQRKNNVIQDGWNNNYKTSLSIYYLQSRWNTRTRMPRWNELSVKINTSLRRVMVYT